MGNNGSSAISAASASRSSFFAGAWRRCGNQLRSVEDEYAVFVRYCFADPLDAAIFRSRFEYRSSRFKLAG